MIEQLKFPIASNANANVSLNGMIILLVAILLSVGLVIISSASIDYSMLNKGEPWFFVKRHLAYLTIALVASVMMLCIPTIFWRKYGWMLFFLACIFLLMVMVEISLILI